MVTQKKIIIPIFDYRVRIVIFDRWSEVDHLFDGGPESYGIVASRQGSCVVAVNADSPDSIAHEALHITNKVWLYIGYNPQRDNDEVSAYLMTYIYHKIKEVHNKHINNGSLKNN